SQVGLAPGRHFAQRWRNIVVIRRANLDRIGAGVTRPLSQRFRTEWATNPEQRQKKAEQAQQTSEKTRKRERRVPRGCYFQIISSISLVDKAAMLWRSVCDFQAF